MGRHGYKMSTDGLLWLDTAKLNGWGYFQQATSTQLTWTQHPGGHKSNISAFVFPYESDAHIRLQYTETDRFTGDKKDYDYKIGLVTTECYFGGKRWWFVCPRQNNRCHYRVRKLYLRSGYFSCRQCNQLTYPSQNENRKGGWAILNKIVNYEQELEKLEPTIKIAHYNGKPTRKMRRYLWLQEQLKNRDAYFYELASRMGVDL